MQWNASIGKETLIDSKTAQSLGASYFLSREDRFGDNFGFAAFIVKT